MEAAVYGWERGGSVSWAELITITQEAKAMRAEDKAKPIVDCPLCGTTLDKRGELVNCPFGHFTKRGTTRGPESY